MNDDIRARTDAIPDRQNTLALSRRQPVYDPECV
jgi:hypothetical protein